MAEPETLREDWHALDVDGAAAALDATLAGLTGEEAARRLERCGPNRIEPPPPPGAWAILLRQFRSPLIYILMAAGVLALALDEVVDAVFIAAVLLVNAGIGFANEIRAEQRVRALASLVRASARVRRGGVATQIDGEEVVPGDLLLLESGVRVPADARLVETRGLRVDESLLTGESVPVEKDAEAVLTPATALAERCNMAFAGSMVVSGRGAALVVATGQATEVGAIAGEIAAVGYKPPPLVVRMERFARVVGAAVLVVCAAVVAIGLAYGQPLGEILLAAVALAVSAVPEGLPIALTVALAVAVSRMVRRRVVVRHLPAVEGLGSCGVIATDKTGTLTRNELTVERLVCADRRFDVSGPGYVPDGQVTLDGRPTAAGEHGGLDRLLRAAALAGEGSLARNPARPEGWEWSGDPTDVALLAAARKAGADPDAWAAAHPTVAAMPFEPERRYTATWHRRGDGGLTCVKGAPERVLAMCDRELGEGDAVRPLDAAACGRAVEELMVAGYRVLAVAEAETDAAAAREDVPPQPAGLCLLGLVAMTDPPREGVREAVAACARAGVRVVMVTGDHAATALAIAERVGLTGRGSTAITGPELAELDAGALAEAVPRYVVVARATPADKLRVVDAWQRCGYFVAVTGDGVNDAPALKQANLGVAMGRSGTDVAREAADLVVTDDDFSSIVAGIEEGRVAYDNVRKVTYLLVSTGAGEVILVTAAIAAGLPLPFTAAQLLWLNLVTNGIQDVALAFEPGEPGVLDRPPRRQNERLFDRLMIERTLLAGAIMAGIGLYLWHSWTTAGMAPEDARPLLVQLFVLFEILHIGNSRSERISILRLNPFSNPLLLLGTLGALGVHLAATYTPALQRILGLQPLPLDDWLRLALFAAPILVLMELHKWLRARLLR